MSHRTTPWWHSEAWLQSFRALEHQSTFLGPKQNACGQQVFTMFDAHRYHMSFLNQHPCCILRSSFTSSAPCKSCHLLQSFKDKNSDQKKHKQPQQLTCVSRLGRLRCLPTSRNCTAALNRIASGRTLKDFIVSTLYWKTFQRVPKVAH